MCGIYGMVSLSGDALRAPDAVELMGRSLRHRGPDSSGVFKSRSVALGCERLRIMDLRKRADQPFASPDARCRLVCNGEIYNASELRRRYPDYPFRSRSDVETILPLYLDQGAQGLGDLDGMFALAIWDEAAGALTLARDRAGEKPFFYSRAGGELWFASEVQALLLNPALSRDLDETAVRQYLALGYVPEPRSTFRDVRKLESGTIARFTASGESVTRYWDPGSFELSNELPKSTIPRLRDLLETAVRKQMVADVPVGIFVSAGLDSALVASIVARETIGQETHTFTARFTDPSYDEGPAAAACAGLTSTRHHEVMVGENELAEALGIIVDRLAEPVADPAILPTYLLAREARKHVTVVLSGEGADELFGGYPTYLGHKLVPYIQALPSAARRMLRAAVGLIPASQGKVTFEFLLKRFLADAEKPLAERHLAWFGTGAGDALAVAGESGAAAAARSIQPSVPLRGKGGATSGGRAKRPPGGRAKRSPGGGQAGSPPGGGRAESLTGAMLLDYRTYLPDDLLTKNDRATMLNSLEARAPFLDRDLSAFALALPERYKVRGLTTKWLLKQAAGKWLPRRTIHRRKRGLSVPVASWIDRGLRSEVDRLLAAERLARQELFDPQPVRRLLAEHRAGKANHARVLWALVIFQYWLERWVPERAG